MKHQPEGIIGRRPPPFPTALKIRLGTTRQPGASPCHQVLANPLSDWQRAEAQHRWDLSKAPMRHWRGWDENPMSTICELKALLGNYGQVLDPLWAFYLTNYNWSERVVLGKGWAGWTRLDGPRSGPAASAQHGRVWRGEAKGVSAVGKEAASYCLLGGQPPGQVALLQAGVRGRMEACHVGETGTWGWHWPQVGSLLQGSWLLLREGQVIGVLFRGVQ